MTFLRKKTAGGHTPGLTQRLYLPEMPTLMHIAFKYQPIYVIYPIQLTYLSYLSCLCLYNIKYQPI